MQGIVDHLTQNKQYRSRELTPEIKKQLMNAGYEVEKVTNKVFKIADGHNESCMCQVCSKTTTQTTYVVTKPQSKKPLTDVDKITLEYDKHVKTKMVNYIKQPDGYDKHLLGASINRLVLNSNKISHDTTLVLKTLGYTCELVVNHTPMSKGHSNHPLPPSYWVITKHDEAMNNIVVYSKQQMLNTLSQ